MHPCPLCQSPSAFFYADSKSKRHYWQCPTCGMVFLASQCRPTLEQEKTEYALHHNDVNDPAYQTFLAPLFDAIAGRHPPEAKGLDYGAGPGPALSLMLEKRGHCMELYDPIYWPGREFVGKPYDFIVCSEVAEHFFNPYQEFQSLHDLLREGGTLALMTRLVVDEQRFANWHYRRDPTHVVFYADISFAWIKQQFGFSTLESDGKSVVVLEK